MLTGWGDLRYIQLNCEEKRRIEWRLDGIETICVGSMTGWGYMEGIRNDLRTIGAMIEQLKDDSRHFRRIESTWFKFEGFRYRGAWGSRGMRNGQRERIWNRTRRSLGCWEVSQLLKCLIDCGRGRLRHISRGTGVHQSADAMVSQQHLGSPLIEGWYFDFKYQGG